MFLLLINSRTKEQSSAILNSQSLERKKRLPDALIMGVKKCGTMTLGLKFENLKQNFGLFFVSDNFLRYHPNLRVRGEISFLEGYDHVMEKMPTAYENETILVKSRGAWHQPDVTEVIRKHYDLIPDVKMIMMVRDPIHRYVSGRF